MKYIFSFLFLFCVTTALGQTSFPAGFKLIKGDNPMGDHDRYSNGKYVFQSHLYWRSYDDYTWNDEKYKQYVAEGLGYPFYQTKDSLLWGTGKTTDGLYSYSVVDYNGEVYELFSQYNDADFSKYSKWLISSIREYRKQGKVFIFPRRFLK
ncbi:hypothetical protein DVR12_18230 [Chitinophaga silvatica]|uniref:Uncharacterized protein n=1 Tax=Chitinophaga silvatica TaxID=2282649 RepID=A0A3E1Y6G1_9BACT|nr:hypothetical protein [Chitinophaga silvatica]RFS20507.1 hypothetical protein DVR12_18230 [Chitinophaga silvatica]